MNCKNYHIIFMILINILFLNELNARTIAFVYDDSQSMWAAAGEDDQQRKWIYANYAAQTMASLLREDDQFIAVKMSDLRVIHLKTGDQDSINQIKQTWTPQKSKTPYEAVEIAMNEILNSDTLREDKIDEQKQDWLFIMTDGIFALHDKTGMNDQDRSQVREKALQFLKQTKGKVRIAFFLIGKTADKKIPQIWENLAPDQVDIFNVAPAEIIKAVRKAAALTTGRDFQFAKIQRRGRMIEFSSLFPVRRLTILEQQSSGQLASISHVNPPDRKQVKTHQYLIKNHPKSKVFLAAKVTHCEITMPENNNAICVMPQGNFQIFFEQNIEYHDIQVLIETAVDFQIKIKNDQTNYCLGDPLILSINFIKAGTREPLKLTQLNTKELSATAFFGEDKQPFSFNAFEKIYDPVSFKVNHLSQSLSVEAKYPGYFYLKSNVFDITGKECECSVSLDKIDMNVKYAFSNDHAAGKNELIVKKVISDRFSITASNIPAGLSIAFGEQRLSKDNQKIDLQPTFLDNHNRLPFTVYNNRHYKDAYDSQVSFRLNFTDDNTTLQTVLLLKPVPREIKLQPNSRVRKIQIEKLGEQPPFKISLTADDEIVSSEELALWSFSARPLSKRLRIKPVVVDKSQILVKPLPWRDMYCSKCITSSGKLSLALQMTGPFPKEQQEQTFDFEIVNDNWVLTFFKVCLLQIMIIFAICLLGFLGIRLCQKAKFEPNAAITYTKYEGKDTSRPSTKILKIKWFAKVWPSSAEKKIVGNFIFEATQSKYLKVSPIKNHKQQNIFVGGIQMDTPTHRLGPQTVLEERFSANRGHRYEYNFV